MREILWGGSGVTNMAARKDGCRSERAVQTASREPSRTGVGGEGAGGKGAGRGKGRGRGRGNGGVGQAAGESRVKGWLLEARVEDPKSVETRKEIQVFRGMVAAITTHCAPELPNLLAVLTGMAQNGVVIPAAAN